MSAASNRPALALSHIHLASNTNCIPIHAEFQADWPAVCRQLVRQCWCSLRFSHMASANAPVARNTQHTLPHKLRGKPTSTSRHYWLARGLLRITDTPLPAAECDSPVVCMPASCSGQGRARFSSAHYHGPADGLHESSGAKLGGLVQAQAGGLVQAQACSPVTTALMMISN
jgi:hypothetical protein